MKNILQEPITVQRITGQRRKSRSTRSMIKIDISGVPWRKRIQVVKNWQQFFKVHAQINAASRKV